MVDSGGNKFFDVTHPGRSAADASSRPVIVSNRPIMDDPMMRPSDKAKIREHTKEQVEPTGSDLAEKNDLPINQQDVLEGPANLEPDPAVEQLTEEKTYFVHIKGAKKGKLLRHLLFLVGLGVMAGIGYYAVTYLMQ